MKRCSRCERDLPLSDFNKCARRKDGLQAYCRECQKVTFHQHFEANPAYHSQRRKDYNQSHAEQVHAYNAARYAANREQVIAAVTEWGKQNIEKRRAKGRRQYRRHKEQYISSASHYAQQHPDRVRRYKNKWQQANPLKRREIKHRRRAREYETSAGTVDYQAIWERDRGVCHICGLFVPPEHLHFDHIIPLSKGGAHTAENIAVSHSWCNLRKGAKPKS